MIKKTVKLKGGFYNGQHLKIDVKAKEFPMIRPKDIPEKYLAAGAKPNPEERCDYLNVWYKRVDDKNFEFVKETDLDGDIAQPVDYKPYPKEIIKVKTEQMVRLKGGRFDNDLIPMPETDIVHISGEIEISDKGWKVVAGRIFLYNDKPIKVKWHGETDCVMFPVLVKFVYKKIDDLTYEFSHVE